MATTSEIPNTVELLEDNTARTSYRTSAARNNSVISTAHDDSIPVLLDLFCKSRMAEGRLRENSHFPFHTAPAWCIRKHKTASRGQLPGVTSTAEPACSWASVLLSLLRFYIPPHARCGWPASPRAHVLPPNWSGYKSLHGLDSKLSKPMEKEHQPLVHGCW